MTRKIETTRRTGQSGAKGIGVSAGGRRGSYRFRTQLGQGEPLPVAGSLEVPAGIGKLPWIF
jgi:hypothetical protein